MSRILVAFSFGLLTLSVGLLIPVTLAGRDGSLARSLPEQLIGEWAGGLENPDEFVPLTLRVEQEAIQTDALSTSIIGINPKSTISCSVPILSILVPPPTVVKLRVFQKRVGNPRVGGDITGEAAKMSTDGGRVGSAASEQPAVRATARPYRVG